MNLMSRMNGKKKIHTHTHTLSSYIVSVLFLLFFWCPCMAINVSVPVAPVAQRYLVTPSDTLGREFDPANGIFLTKKL